VCSRIAPLAIAATIAFVGTALASSAASRSVRACATSGLVVWVNTQPGGAAAGSFYYTLEFTNLSGRTCTLRGYPGMSAIDLRGRQLGRPAGRLPTTRLRTITLRPGASATAVLRIADVYNYAAGACRPTRAAGLRVYPPNQTRAKTAPFPFLACTKATPTYLDVAGVRHA
jgi:hypothetical protein